MASWGPPDGLPAGRLIVPDPQYAGANPVTEPVLWITEDPPPEPGPLWVRLLAEHPATGLWPLLLTTNTLVAEEQTPWGGSRALMTEFGSLDEGLHQPSPDASTPQSLGLGPSVG